MSKPLDATPQKRDWPEIVRQTKIRRAEKEEEAKQKRASKAKPPRKTVDRTGWTVEQKKARELKQQAEWRKRNADKRREMDRKKYERRRVKLIAEGALIPRTPLTPEEKVARRTEKNRKTRARRMVETPGKWGARREASRAKADGRLVPTSCVLCDSSNEIEAHHRNYARPLDVTWLCKPCHQGVHKFLTVPEPSADLFASFL